MRSAQCQTGTSIDLFDKPLSSGDVGEVEITYSYRGWRAIYGFTADGKLTPYAN